MTASVPFTWEEMRARFEPTMPPEACEICQQIPASSRDEFPEAWKRLENAELPGQTDSFVRYRCPICHQLYHWSYEIPWNSYDPGNPDLAGAPFTTLCRMPLRSSFDELISYRVADERFARAMAAIEPQQPPAMCTYLEAAPPFWTHHQVMRVAYGEAKRWVALSEDGELTHCTLAEMARIAATDPPSRLDELPRVFSYANFIDLITSGWQYRYSIVLRFEDIMWRNDRVHTDAEHARIEELRRTNHIEPERIERLADRTIVVRWVVVDSTLTRRVLTVRPTGELQREVAIIADALPTPPW